MELGPSLEEVEHSIPTLTLSTVIQVIPMIPSVKESVKVMGAILIKGSTDNRNNLNDLA